MERYELQRKRMAAVSALGAISQSDQVSCHRIMRRALVSTVVALVVIHCWMPHVSAEERLLVREVPGMQCLATEPAYEFLLSHPAFAAALFGRLYPPLRDYSVTQPTARRIRVINRHWGLEGEADVLTEQPGKRIYRAEIIIPLTATRELSALIEIVLEYRQERASPNPLVVSRLAFYLLPHPSLPSVMAQAAANLLVPLINRQVQAVTEGSWRGCDRMTTDPGGLYREMVAWPEISRADLAAYHRLFLDQRR